MRQPVGKVMAVFGAFTVAIAMTACSSSSKHAATTPTSASPATTAAASGTAASGTSASAQPSGTPIKVGLVCSCSGPFGSSLVPAEEVYKAWVNTVNASGGLSGHPIQLSTKDDGANPGNSISDIQSLISANVAAIVDVSLVDQSWESTVQAAKIPIVGGSVTEVPMYTNPDFYPEGATEQVVPFEVAELAKDAGASKLGYFYCTEAAVCASTAATIAAATAKLGEPVIYRAAISATAPNYTAQCVAAHQAGVEGIINGDSDAVFKNVAADCAQQDYHPAYISSGLSFDPTMTSAPGIKDNSWYTSNDLPYWANTPAVQAMNAAVNKYYPGLVGKANIWTGESVTSWASGLLLADAVKAGGLTAAGTPTAQEIVQGLESLKGDTLDGLAPPLTFAAGQPHPIDCWFTFQVRNGVPDLVNNGALTCENGSSVQ